MKKYEKLRVYNPFGNLRGPWRIVPMDCHVIQKEILGKRISVEFMFGESLFISLFSQLMLFTAELEKDKLDMLFSECCLGLRYPPRSNTPR